MKTIAAGVPQGSVLGPVLYVLFTSDIPHTTGTTIGTFADDTAVMAVGETTELATSKLQRAINHISDWTKMWRIKLNEAKSVHVDFTLKKTTSIPLVLNDNIIPYSNTAKYLGMTLDAKLRWKEHVKKKKEELVIKYRKMYWLLGRKSELSTENKLLVYKQILKPVWTYGLQLWGCTKMTNISMIQTFQNKVLRGIVNAPWYARNVDIHRDLQVEMVTEVIKKKAAGHQKRLETHVNPNIITLLDKGVTVTRLKRTRPQDLCT